MLKFDKNAGGYACEQSHNAPRLLEQMAICLEERGCARITRQAYSRWIVEFVRFHGMTHPRQMGHREIQEFLHYLGDSLGRAPATRNQALNALLFLYKRVLNRNVRGWHRTLRIRKESTPLGSQKLLGEGVFRKAFPRLARMLTRF